MQKASRVVAGFHSVSWFTRPVTPPNPRIIQAVVVGVILCVVFFPRVVGKALDWFLENTFERFVGGKKSED